jgi:hypothetical protein
MDQLDVVAANYEHRKPLRLGQIVDSPLFLAIRLTLTRAVD